MFDEEQIIGYDPRLSYSKEKDLLSNETINLSNNNFNDINYKNYSPSIVLESMNNTISTIESLIKKVSKMSDSKDIQSFLNEMENNNKEYIKDILLKNSDISGDSVFNILYLLKNLQTRAKNIVKLTKKMYYGKEEVLESEIELINESIFAKINQYDKSEDSYKVNYGVLNLDSKLNKSLEILSYSINSEAINLAGVYKSGLDISVESSSSGTVLKIFNEINEKYLKNQSSLDYNSEKMLLEKSFYNYYLERKEWMDTGKLCYKTQDSIPFLLNFVEEKQNETEEAIELLLKNNEWYNNKISSISSLLAQREQIKKVYNQFELN